MMRAFSLAVIFSFFFLVIPARSMLAQTIDLQTDFTYQGYLTHTSGAVNGLCNFQFGLFDAALNGNQIGTTQQLSNVVVSHGAFSVQLDFGAGSFNGQDRFLEIAVQCPADAAFTTLIPRQPVTPAPYAGYALSVPWLGITGIPAGFADGLDNEGWALTGNAGTTPGTHFIGTTDNVALEFFVNNLRALRIEPVDDGTYSGNNVIGGYSGNTVAAGVVGATVLGGGELPNSSIGYINSVLNDFGTVSGGRENTADGLSATVGGGSYNTAGNSVATVGGGGINTASGNSATVSGGNGNIASGNYSIVSGGVVNRATGQSATVSGGNNNRATGHFAIVGGGQSNLAADNYGTIGGGGENQVGSDDADTENATYATVGGGGDNTASGAYSTVGGGFLNTASGSRATVAGGQNNTAAGAFSFVAGHRAKNTVTTHNGVFLFADSTNTDFNSTAANEFAARATGGVRFVVGSTTCTVTSGTTAWSCTSSREAKHSFESVNSRAVLETLVDMPITTWALNGSDITHMGPVAEDFYAVFGLGVDDKSISTVDADGVALAAIQGLYDIVQEKDAQIGQLQIAVIVLAGIMICLLIGGVRIYRQLGDLREKRYP